LRSRRPADRFDALDSKRLDDSSYRHVTPQSFGSIGGCMRGKPKRVHASQLTSLFAKEGSA
jgi:hypothetical protein